MGLLRLFLAAVVALSHFQLCILLPIDANAGSILNYLKLGHDGGHAVIFFYVISGFLISYSLERKYGTDTSRFYQARFLRIFPLYWFLYGMMILFDYGGTAQNIKDSPVVDWLPGLLLFGSDWAVSFLRYPNSFMAEFPSFLTPAWSLGAEVTFYALAPFLLFRHRKLCVAVLIVSATIRGVAVYMFGFHETWTLHFFPATLMFFLIGHFSREIYNKIGHHLGSLNHAWLPIFFGLSLYNVTTAVPFDGPFFYLELFAITCSLPFLFEKTKDIRWMNILGDQSYPLYLSHLLTMSLLAFAPALMTELGGGNKALLSGLPIEFRFLVYAVLYVAACVAVSFLLHFLVEIPLTTLGAQLLRRRAWRERLGMFLPWGQWPELWARRRSLRLLPVHPAGLLRVPTVVEADHLSTPAQASTGTGGHGTGG